MRHCLILGLLVLAACAGNQAGRRDLEGTGRNIFDGTLYETPSGGLIPGQLPR